MPERGEDVLCYHCNNVFPKDTFGLMCPRCGSDFTEIVSIRAFSNIYYLENML